MRAQREERRGATGQRGARSSPTYCNPNPLLARFVRARCEKLVAIDLFRTKITALPDGTFFGCPSLNAVLLPKKLKEIGEEAFNR